jgi:hypothetical protein
MHEYYLIGYSCWDFLAFAILFQSEVYEKAPRQVLSHDCDHLTNGTDSYATILSVHTYEPKKFGCSIRDGNAGIRVVHRK